MVTDDTALQLFAVAAIMCYVWVGATQGTQNWVNGVWSAMMISVTMAIFSYPIMLPSVILMILLIVMAGATTYAGRHAQTHRVRRVVIFGCAGWAGVAGSIGWMDGHSIAWIAAAPTWVVCALYATLWSDAIPRVKAK